MDAVWVVLVALSGILAGAAVNNAIAMVPALRTLEEMTDHDVRRAWSRVPGACVGMSAAGAGIAGVVLLAFAHQVSSGSRALLIAGIVLSIATACVGVAAILVEGAAREPILVEGAAREPILVEGAAREPILVEGAAHERRPGGGHPSAYRALQRRWDALQVLAAVFSLGMLACNVVAAGPG